MPLAIPIGLKAQAIAIPRAQGPRIGGPHEVSTDAGYTFHGRHVATTDGSVEPDFCDSHSASWLPMKGT
jgi:hypothetical protein